MQYYELIKARMESCFGSANLSLATKKRKKKQKKKKKNVKLYTNVKNKE